jgi:hypothetical protein
MAAMKTNIDYSLGDLRRNETEARKSPFSMGMGTRAVSARPAQAGVGAAKQGGVPENPPPLTGRVGRHSGGWPSLFDLGGPPEDAVCD